MALVIGLPLVFNIVKRETIETTLSLVHCAKEDHQHKLLQKSPT